VKKGEGMFLFGFKKIKTNERYENWERERENKKKMRVLRFF